jgi:hypothetical protein
MQQTALTVTIRLQPRDEELYRKPHLLRYRGAYYRSYCLAIQWPKKKRGNWLITGANGFSGQVPGVNFCIQLSGECNQLLSVPALQL